MAENKLIDSKLRRWIADGKPIARADGGGLTFTLSPAGTATWVLRYRYAKRARELTLGNYPDLSLQEARRRARIERAQVDAGHDVAALKQKRILARRKETSFREVAELWFQDEIKARIKHPHVVRRILDKDILPVLGKWPIKDIDGLLVHDMLRPIQKRKANAICNDALRFTRRIFTYARKRQYIPINPIADFTPKVDGGGSESARDRALSLEEVQQLFAAMRRTPNLGRENELAVKLLLALGVRKGELLRAQWSEFKFDIGRWELDGSRTKNRRSIWIPLAPQVVEWLKILKGMAAGHTHVFPTRKVQKRRWPHVSPDTLNVALKRVNHGLKDFTLHDFRRTVRTNLSAMGVERNIAERVLNHRLSGIETVYNVYDYYEQRKKALQLWVDKLVEIDGQDSKIVMGRFGQSA